MTNEAKQLSREQALAMPAGVELDALVSERLFDRPSIGLAPCVWTDDGLFVQPGCTESYVIHRPVWLKACGCESMDALVEEMNAKRGSDFFKNEKTLGHGASCLEIVPNYSENISASWDLLEMLRRKFDGLNIGVESEGEICVTVNAHDYSGIYWQASADTFPLALCRAALLTTI